MRKSHSDDRKAQLHARASFLAEKRIRNKHLKEYRAKFDAMRDEFKREHWVEYDAIRTVYYETLKREEGLSDNRRGRLLGRPISERRMPCPKCGAKSGEPCRTPGGSWVKPHAARREADTVKNKKPTRKDYNNGR